MIYIFFLFLEILAGITFSYEKNTELGSLMSSAPEIACLVSP